MQKVIVWDIGNVVFFTRFERAGRFLEKRYGISAERVMDLFWRNGWHGKCLEHSLHRSEMTDGKFRETAERELGITIPEGTFWRMWNIQWEPNPPVISLIEKVAAMPRPPIQSVCSNINQPNWTYLCSTYPVMERFSVAALSYRVCVMKPDHRMFRAVTDRVTISEVSPPVLFVDDREGNVQSAEGYGWSTHLYQQGEEDVLEQGIRNFLDAAF